MTTINQITQLLYEQNICNQEVGSITFNFMGQEIPVETKDVIGGILQNWFGNWLTQHHISWSKPINSQEPPDFILAQNEHLEFKTFDADASPNFDLANFDAYTRRLLTHAECLDTDHLVFAYRLTGNQVCITNFWVKKIWQMTGPSDTNILNLQVKQGSPVNIRPKNWDSPRVETFASRLDFVQALNLALQRFHPNRYPNWLNDVCINYRSKTGNDL